MTKKQSSYTAKDIQVLKGLTPIRKRPGMYIGSTGTEGLHHLVVEVVGNSIDEAIMGYCSKIEVIFLPDNRIKIKDNGRGIPVDEHPQTKKSALETIMTTLHAGGKFGSKAYDSTGGLHGVGISVVSALSTFMKVTVSRDGYKHSQEYSKGVAKTKLEKIGKSKGSGTTIVFEPDAEIFHNLKFNKNKIVNYLRQQAYLTKNLEVLFKDETVKPCLSYGFYFEGGITSYLKYLIGTKELINDDVFYCSKKEDNILVEAAFIYTDDYEASEHSFVNNICTHEGGSHLTGFRSALTRTVNDYARNNGFLKEKEENFNGRDVREGITSIISIKISEPQFEGQTKSKLGNPEAKPATERAIGTVLLDFLERNPQNARKIINRFLLTQKARNAAKAAKDTILKKKILQGLALPGKLSSCSSRKPEESELYIVEGQSAGGSSRQARDRHFQAILPLRGKILNVERARLDRILNSEEIKNLIIALGTAIADDFNLDKLKYHKVVIMCDADSDGNHIKTLLLTLFYRYFKPLIENGYIYVACPPLYKIQVGKKIHYAFTEEEKLDILKELGDVKVSLQRYKGLGEMNPEELWNTTMDPKSRKFLQINIEEAREADKIFDILMGKEVPLRKKFIQSYADKVQNLDV